MRPGCGGAPYCKQMYSIEMEKPFLKVSGIGKLISTRGEWASGLNEATGEPAA
jgi:hypothetical protein